MPAFKASEAVSKLDFDLDPYGPSGVVPEPSVAQIDALTAALAKLAGDDLTGGTAGLLKHVSEMPEEEQQAILDGLHDAIADITGAVLTRDQIKALPYRVQKSFLGWLTGSLLLPEDGSPATTS